MIGSWSDWQSQRQQLWMFQSNTAKLATSGDHRDAIIAESATIVLKHSTITVFG